MLRAAPPRSVAPRCPACTARAPFTTYVLLGCTALQQPCLHGRSVDTRQRLGTLAPLGQKATLRCRTCSYGHAVRPSFLRIRGGALYFRPRAPSARKAAKSVRRMIWTRLCVVTKHREPSMSCFQATSQQRAWQDAPDSAARQAFLAYKARKVEQILQLPEEDLLYALPAANTSFTTMQPTKPA